ncbi:uncharacterized protein LOC109136555 [Beta vulgaris subsp. vulgaris]|uniref:uncharacterized protein LOC109136555 n=1 Tax=Beta vulgaris subsp. vulgaris TaxID=3555 RepID=UPI0020368165|nr:uncharacterized protein LOC109136555 [Beta vulgaris subsp. vulgaris]
MEEYCISPQEQAKYYVDYSKYRKECLHDNNWLLEKKPLVVAVPPTYDGAADPVALENWLREMEKLFTATNCPVTEMVPIYLKREADNWWSTVRAACMATAGFGWTQFSAKLKERFYPDELRWQKQEEFLSLTQGNMDIQKYTDHFTELSKFAGTVIPTEAERVKRYIKKMDPREEETAKIASVRKPVPSFAPGPAKKPRFEPNFRGGYQGSNSRPSFDSSKCRRCEKPNHPGKDCDGSAIVCFYFREAGHKSYECPKNLRATAKPPATPSHSASPKNRVYKMTHSDADVHPDVISGTFLINSVPGFVLFDYGASVSYVSTSFAKKANLSSSSPLRTLISLPSVVVIDCRGNCAID